MTFYQNKFNMTLSQNNYNFFQKVLAKNIQIIYNKS